MEDLLGGFALTFASFAWFINLFFIVVVAFVKLLKASWIKQQQQQQQPRAQKLCIFFRDNNKTILLSGPIPRGLTLVFSLLQTENLVSNESKLGRAVNLSGPGIIHYDVIIL